MRKPPHHKPARKPARAVSQEERALWHRVMDDVELLPEDPGAPASEAEPATHTPGKTKQKHKTPARRQKSKSAPASAPGPPSAPSRDPELRHGEAPGLDKRTQTRMRRGQLEIEATLDLHGLTQTEAHRALDAFLGGSQSAGLRAVLVITGKGGEKSLGPGRGVLRDAVPRWLNEGPNRRIIKAFSHAAPKDGGQGALYILLKRPR